MIAIPLWRDRRARRCPFPVDFPVAVTPDLKAVPGVTANRARLVNHAAAQERTSVVWACGLLVEDNLNPRPAAASLLLRASGWPSPDLWNMVPSRC